MRILIVVATLALGGCAAADRPSQAAALTSVPGKAIGKPVSCIQSRDIDRVEAVNDYVALIHMRGRKLYRTDFASSCRGLKRDAFSHRSSTAQYCRGDIITTFDPASGVSSGSCVFEAFVPYELPKDDRAEG